MLTAICLVTATAAAEPPKHLPKGERIDEGKPTEQQCYTFPEFQLLLKIDSALTACQTAKKLLEDKAEEHGAIILDLTKVISLQAASVGALQAENKRVFELWKDENKRRHEAENKPHWGSWAGWGTAGVMTAVTAILVTVILVDD